MKGWPSLAPRTFTHSTAWLRLLAAFSAVAAVARALHPSRSTDVTSAAQRTSRDTRPGTLGAAYTSQEASTEAVETAELQVRM